MALGLLADLQGMWIPWARVVVAITTLRNFSLNSISVAFLILALFPAWCHEIPYFMAPWQKNKSLTIHKSAAM